MTIPSKLLWGRIGRDAHMRRIEKELIEEFVSMDVPPVLAYNLAARAAAIFGNWDPFMRTWFHEYEMEDA